MFFIRIYNILNSYQRKIKLKRFNVFEPNFTSSQFSFVLFLILRNGRSLYLPKFNHLKIHASFNDFYADIISQITEMVNVFSCVYIDVFFLLIECFVTRRPHRPCSISLKIIYFSYNNIIYLYIVTIVCKVLSIYK